MPDKVLLLVDDLVLNFLYYDRKEDEDIPLDTIENLVAQEQLTEDQIVDRFRKALRVGLGHS